MDLAIRQILEDQNIRARFASDASIQSIRKMQSSADGGVEHVLGVLRSRVCVDKRASLIRQRLQKAVHRLLSLCAEHMPCESATQRLKEDIDQVTLAIRGALKEKGADPDVRDPSAWVGYRLRRLLNFDAAMLDPIPLEAAVTQRSLVPYIENQMQRWIDSKRSLQGMEAIGVGDWGMRARVLTYFAQRVPAKTTAQWLRNELGHIRNRSDASDARRSLALHLAREMLNGHAYRPYPDLAGSDGVLERVRQWAEQEAEAGAEGYGKAEDSPHYSKVILPIMAILDDMKAQAAASRPPQVGDSEIAALHHDLSLQSATA